MSAMAASFRKCAVLLLLLLLATAAVAKRKDDVVVMKNGDRFTGEIKALEQGELVFKSDYMAQSVHLDWKRVDHLESKDYFLFSLSNGAKYSGLIEELAGKENEDRTFRITSYRTTLVVSQPEIIAIEQREVTFLHQLKGSVSYGFDFASEGQHVTSSFAGDVSYETSRNSVKLASTSQIDTQDTGSTNNRFTADFRYGRWISERWVAAAMFSALTSNQQDLTLRTTYGAGMGRKLVQTNRTEMVATAGLVFTREQYSSTSGSPLNNNAEFVLGVDYAMFKFRKLSVGSQSNLYTGITDSGRLRFQTQSNAKIELVRNFFWQFNLYENFDSQPPVTAPRNDLGISSSLGWTF